MSSPSMNRSYHYSFTQDRRQKLIAENLNLKR